MKRSLNLVAALATTLVFSACGDSAAGTADAATPEGAAQSLFTALGNKQAGQAWNALPPSYQKDATEVVHGFAAKVDKEVYDKGVGLVNNLVGVLRDKKDYFIASATSMPMLPVKKEDLEGSWDGVVGLFDTLANSDLADLDKLKTLDVGAFVDRTGSELLQKVFSAAAATGEDPAKKLNAMKTELVNNENGVAEVKISYGDDTTETVKMKQVDGKWLPATMVDDWTAQISQAKESIAKMEMTAEDKAGAIEMISQVDAMLGQLNAAKTQEEFGAVFQGLAMQAMMAAGSMGGGR